MIDFYRLKIQVKQNILRFWQAVDIASDPFTYAWIMYTLSIESDHNNPLLVQALNQSQRWLVSENAWIGYGNLAGISLLCLLSSKQDNTQFKGQQEALVSKLIELRDKGISKFSKLNDPYFMLGVSIGVKNQLPEDLSNYFMQHCEQSAKASSNLVRSLLFTAAAFELGAKIAPIILYPGDLHAHEYCIGLWFVERYPQLILGNQVSQDVWNAFEKIKEGLDFELSTTSEQEGIYPVSPLELAMLYEALCRSTTDLDPIVFFLNFPWHPDIRKAAESLFLKGEYVNSVFEAAKMFVEATKAKAGHPTDPSGKALDGATLMDKVFFGSNPVLKINLGSTQSDKDEQQGVGFMAKGIIAGLRNPKGHTPAVGIPLSPFEALEQLSTISYLMRYLDKAVK